MSCAGLKARLGKWMSTHDAHVVELLRGASIAGVLKVLSAALAFALSVVLGRVLGAELAGIYFLAITVATVAATIGRAGLDSAVIRFVATNAANGEWNAVRKSYRTTLEIGFVCSVVVAVVLYAAADLLANRAFHDPSTATPIRIASLAVVPLAIGVLTSGALLGLSRIRDALLVLSILPTGIALVGTWLLASRWATNGAMVAYLVAVIAALLYGAATCAVAVRHDRGNAASQDSPSPAKALLAAGAPLLLGALLQLIMHSSGTVMLGMWSTSSEVSHYALAWRTASLIGFVLIAINTTAQPKFAALYARGEFESLATTARKANLLMTVCAVPVVLVFLAAPALVMGLFGSDFSGGATALRILAAGQFVNVALGSVGVLLVMSAKEREYRNVQIASAAIVLLLNVALIPKLGATGAAVAAAAGLVVQNILFAYFVWARLGIVMFSSRPYRRRTG